MAFLVAARSSASLLPFVRPGEAERGPRLRLAGGVRKGVRARDHLVFDSPRSRSNFTALRGRIAIVTGASRNIGRAIALRLAEDGCDVAVTAVEDESAIQGVAREIEALGRRALPLLLDVAVPSEVTTAVDSVLETFGRIDILVNNAGIRPHADFVSLAPAEWHRAIDVNLHGPFYLCKAVVPTMIAQRSGSIININGSVAYGGGGRRPAATASKSGLLGLTRSLAFELGKYGIRANSIVLGLMNTERKVPLDPEAVAADLAQTPLGRPGTVADVANACAFLASDESAFITGQSIHLNGGLQML